MKRINTNEIVKLIQIGKVIIVFHGVGCFNCKLMQPIIESLEPIFPHIKFYSLNVDLHPHLIQSYKITTLPTLLLFRHGKMLQTIEGVKSLQILKKLIDQTLNYA